MLLVVKLVMKGIIILGVFVQLVFLIVKYVLMVLHVQSAKLDTVLMLKKLHVRATHQELLEVFNLEEVKYNVHKVVLVVKMQIVVRVAFKVFIFKAIYVFDVILLD